MKKKTLGERLNKKLFFFAHFLRNPKNVGALSALNENVAQSLLTFYSQRAKSRPCKILEVGAGTGSITKQIIAEMNPKDEVDLIEIDPDCCELLESNYGSYPGVHVRCCSILDWHPQVKYDFIISTLPFNSFPPEFVKKVLDHYQGIGSADCICTYVEYIGLQNLDFIFSTKDHREEIKERKSLLKGYQQQFLIKKSEVFLNFLPCHVYHLKLS